MPGAYTMTVEEAVGKVRVAPGRLTEVHIVNGLHPGLPFSYYEELLRAIKRERPQLHLKGFTAVEIHFFAEHYGMTIERGARAAGRGRARLAARRRRRDLRRSRAPEDLRRQGRRRRLARDPSRRAPDGPAHQLHDALRAHRDRRGARRSPGAPARAAGRDRRLPDLHPARVPQREQRAEQAAGTDGRRRSAHVRGGAPDARQHPARQGLLGDARRQGGADRAAVRRRRHRRHRRGRDDLQDGRLARARRADALGAGALIRAAGRIPVERDTLYNVVAEGPALDAVLSVKQRKSLEVLA